MADLSHLNLPAAVPRGRIPDDFIRSLRERADIVSVIDRHVPLKKRGKDHWARCPFHEDGSPSFSVNEGKRFYHCFGCNAHGDALDFLVRHLGLSFPDAVRQLAGEMGLQVPHEPAAKPARPVPKVVRLERPTEDGDEPVALPDDLAAFLRGAQDRLDDPRAVAYLEQRRIPLALARRYGLGFAPAGFRGLPGGLLNDGPRIVAPHTRPDGVPVSLYGRRIDECDKSLRHRHLSERSRGIFNAPTLGQTDGPLWLCEGVFDALSLAAVGVARPVAIFGLGRMRWSWLASGQRELVLAIDTDAAGEKAVGGFLREAAMRGLVVSRLTSGEMGGAKDVNEALAGGVLRIDGLPAIPTTSVPHEVHTSTASSALVAELARLAHVPDEVPDGAPRAKWMRFAPLCRRFALEYAERAAALGWTLDELASLPTMRTGTDAGALWDAACAGADALEVFADRIELRTHAGSVLTVRRVHLRPSGIMPWAAPWERDAA